MHKVDNCVGIHEVLPVVGLARHTWYRTPKRRALDSLFEEAVTQTPDPPRSVRFWPVFKAVIAHPRMILICGLFVYLPIVETLGTDGMNAFCRQRDSVLNHFLLLQLALYSASIVAAAAFPLISTFRVREALRNGFSARALIKRIGTCRRRCTLEGTVYEADVLLEVFPPSGSSFPMPLTIQAPWAIELKPDSELRLLLAKRMVWVFPP